MTNIQELRAFKKIYMIGIGGSSMSGIAAILNKWGFDVSGSDAQASDNIDRLVQLGIEITIGSNPDDVRGKDLVIYTQAIPETNSELVKARELEIPTVERAEFVGFLTKAFRNSICVSGTHGKSTTSSMVTMCFLEAGLDPTVQIGADLKALDGNYRVGESDFFILESCEYRESFLHFFPKAEIILNIDNDHLDYFGDLEHIKQAFIKYVELLPDDGILVYNADDKNCTHISQYTKAKSITYGIDASKANFVARNIEYDKNGFASFDAYHNNVFYKTIKLSVPGKHNVSNALACIAMCDEFGLDKESIKNGLAKFTGAARRFEYLGDFKGAKVFDDYGHHPTEIMATAKALKLKKYNHSWVVFQPHTFSRTEAHLNEFAEVLQEFDNIILADIYAAREKNLTGISSRDIVDLIDKSGRKAYYIPEMDDIYDFLSRNVKDGDVIITQGAGTLNKLAKKLVGE